VKYQDTVLETDGLMDILSTILESKTNCKQCCIVLSQCKLELNTPELIELLQKSAVEQHSNNIILSSAHGAILWFCSHDCHNSF